MTLVVSETAQTVHSARCRRPVRLLDMKRPPALRSALVALATAGAVVVGAVTAGAATTTPTASATVSAPNPAFYETFSNPTWYRNWGLAGQPWHSAILAEGGNAFLRVGIRKGAHDGTSFFKSTGNYDAVTMRYRIRFSEGFDPSQASHNVKLPGFGSPLLGLGGTCLSSCGGAMLDKAQTYSARVDIQDTGVPGFYVYDANTLPLSYGRGIRWATTPFQTERWYDVEVAIAMNTIGRADGVLKATVNGQVVMDRRDVLFRLVPTMHVGSAWFDFYYGGSGVAPADTLIDVDDVQLFAGVL